MRRAASILAEYRSFVTTAVRSISPHVTNLAVTAEAGLTTPDNQHLDSSSATVRTSRTLAQCLEAKVAMELSELCPIEFGRMATSFTANPELVLREEFVDRLEEHVLSHVDTVVWGALRHGACR
jgi:hypothetical protein